MPNEDAVVLYEGQLPATSTLAYTAPAGRDVVVTGVSLVNITAGAVTARIDRVPAGDTDGTTDEVYNGSIAANATVELADDVVTLLPGDTLYVSAGAATSIDCVISGELRVP